MRTILILLAVASTAQAGYPYRCYTPAYYQTYVAQVVAVPTPSDPNWRTGVINALYQKNKMEADSADYSLALQALTGAPLGQAYGGPVAAQGSTVYGEYARGYNSANPLQAYQQTNLETLFSMSNRHVENSQSLAGQAQGGFLQAVNAANLGNERVATILAKVELLKAAEPPETKRIGQETRSHSGFQGSSQQQRQYAAPPTAGASAGLASLGKLMATKCFSCHSGETIKGGVDLSQYPTFDETAKQRVRATIHWDDQPDESKRMPRSPDGGLGEELSFADKLKFAY